MTRLVFLASVLSVALVCTSNTAIAQWISGYYGHHHHFGFPWCGSDVFVWQEVIEVPLIETVVVPTAPLLSFPPTAAHRPPAAALTLDRGENLARKQMWLPDNGNDPDAAPWHGDAFDDAAEIRRRASVLKRSTPAGRMRADREISQGDQAFAQQKLARATAQYRDAIAKAPDYAEAHFRLAHAYVATRQYNLALKSALVAIELSGSIRRDGFSLEDMYQGDQFPREQHLRRLIDASLREPTDGGLQFLIGFTLHFDGQRALAQKHFLDASRLAGAHQTYVHRFLPLKSVAEPKEAAN